MTEQPSEEDIQAFIIAIKSGSYQPMKETLDIYTNRISNKLESQLRQPPLYFAAINPDEEVSLKMVKALVEAGANPNFKDANEQTILFYVCRDGKAQVAEYLLTQGCKLDDEDLYKQTPIFYVASEGQTHMLYLFTTEMVNHVDELAKQTPLYYAARKGHLNMCKALIEKGCNIMHTDLNKKTAADYAKKHKFNDISEYLTSQIKKIKDVNKSQNLQESSQNEAAKRKKKDSSFVNVNKKSYKLTEIDQGGELHQLTEEELKVLYKKFPNIESFLTNPDAVPTEVMEEALKKSWQKPAQQILNKIWKMKGAYYFYDPVDPVKYQVQDYFQVITHPMDLNSIKKNLSFNLYGSPHKFMEDMRLIWNNCYDYNGEDHEISILAKQMQKAFQQCVGDPQFSKFT